MIDISNKSLKPKKEEEKVSLTNILEELVTNCSLKDYIYLKAEEVSSYTSCIKQFSIQGRVSKELEMEANQLQIKICERLEGIIGNNFNINQFWKVDCGLREGDKFLPVDTFDLNGEKISISHEPGTVLIIHFWSIWSELENYLTHKIEIMQKIANGLIEGVTLDKVRCISISGEENFSYWKKYASKFDDLNKLIPQFNNKNIYDTIGIKQVPFVAVVDQDGIIRYLGIFKNINIEESLKSLFLNNDSNNKSIVKSNAADDDWPEVNPNAWWLEMEPELKVEYVKNINLSMREIGCDCSQFTVLTKYIYKQNQVKTNTIPIFLGNVMEFEQEILESYAIELQQNFNFNNIKFNCNIIKY